MHSDDDDNDGDSLWSEEENSAANGSDYELDSFLVKDAEDDVLSGDDDASTYLEPEIEEPPAVLPPKKKVRLSPKKKGVSGTPRDEKQPGDPTYPVNSFSLTISKVKGDVPIELLQVMSNWIKQFCIKGRLTAN